MKYDMTTVINDLRGEPAQVVDETASKKEQKEGKTRDLLLRDIIVDALMAPDNPQQDRVLKGVEKIQRFMLAQRVMKEDQLSLAAEEITLIKDDVSLAYPPLFVGRVSEIIDPVSVGRDDDTPSKDK